MSGLLSILQHADTAFPSGGFAFSNGLEALIAEGAVGDAAGLGGVVEGLIAHRWAGCDRVALVGAHRDPQRLPELDAALEAACLPASQRNGSRRNGAAFLTAHDRLGTPGAAALRARLREGDLLGHLAVLQGAIWRALGIEEAACVLMSGYAMASGICAASVRLGFVGALDAQRVLSACLPIIAGLAETPAPTEMRSFTPWIDIAVARQSSAELRLFAS